MKHSPGGMGPVTLCRFPVIWSGACNARPTEREWVLVTKTRFLGLLLRVTDHEYMQMNYIKITYANIMYIYAYMVSCIIGFVVS